MTRYKGPYNDDFYNQSDHDIALNFGCILFFIIAIFIVIVCAISLIHNAAKADANAVRYQQPLITTYTSTGDTIEVYIVEDPEKERQYLVYNKGGITPRL